MLSVSVIRLGFVWRPFENSNEQRGRKIKKVVGRRTKKVRSGASGRHLACQWRPHCRIKAGGRRRRTFSSQCPGHGARLVAGGVSVRGSPGEQQRDPGQFPRDRVRGWAGGGGRRLLSGRGAVRHEVCEAARTVLPGPSDGRTEQVTNTSLPSVSVLLSSGSKYTHEPVFR